MEMQPCVCPGVNSSSTSSPPSGSCQGPSPVTWISHWLRTGTQPAWMRNQQSKRTARQRENCHAAHNPAQSVLTAACLHVLQTHSVPCRLLASLCTPGRHTAWSVRQKKRTGTCVSFFSLGGHAMEACSSNQGTDERTQPAARQSKASTLWMMRSQPSASAHLA